MTTQIYQNLLGVDSAVSVFAIVSVIFVIHAIVSADFVRDHILNLCAFTSLMTDNDFDDSISSYSHTDSNHESSTEYSDLSKTESVTIDEHPFLNAILNIPHPQLINTLTQTDN